VIGEKPRRTRAARDECGQITALLLIFSVCLLLAIIAVTDISASYLRRQAVTSLADGAALAASDGAAAAWIYGKARDDFVVIAQPAAAAAVHSYLRETGAYASYPGLHIEASAQGHTVTVDHSMPYRLPSLFLESRHDHSSLGRNIRVPIY
jgi:hypothetical protein